jgi:Uma2 family endonuclease
VPEVWIVDLSARAVEVYRDPIEGRYASSSRITQGPLTAGRVPAVTIEVSTLFA